MQYFRDSEAANEGQTMRHFLGFVFMLMVALAGAGIALAQESRPPPTTDDDSPFAVYEFQPGDTLYSIAKRHHTTVEALRALNRITDPNLVYVGDRILVPKIADVAELPAFGFGIQIYPDIDGAAATASQVVQLGVNWVKIDVPWASIEPTKGRLNYAELDAAVAALDAVGVRILLNVYKAPAWSRRSYTATLNKLLRPYSGPPEDLNDFGAFMADLAARYAGVVDAYEIWKTPNLLKFWTAPVYHQPLKMNADGDYGIPDEIQLGAVYYVRLLQIAYAAVKSADSDALVITAGLAPVGFSDSYNAIDTGTFLNNMLLQGAADFSDGIGAIFGASAVPPTMLCCQQPAGVDSHYESFLQYFLEILPFYHRVLTQNNLGHLPIFVTQAGWGTTDGANLAVPADGFEWLTYTSEDEQALYVTQAYEEARKLEYVAAMFLYNLNGCAAGDAEACFFSLIDADETARPAFAAYQMLEKQPPG